MSDIGDRKGNGEERRSKPRGLQTVVTVFLILVGVLLIVDMFSSGIGPTKVSYTDFLERLYTCQFTSVKARGDTQLVATRKEGGKEVSITCEIPLGELQNISSDLIRFSGLTTAEIEEQTVLDKLENKTFEPVRCWVVPRETEEKTFLSFYEKSERNRTQRAQLAEIVPISGTAIDMVRLREALRGSDVEIERMNLGGARNSFNYESQNKFLVTLFWNFVPWLLIFAVFWFFLFRHMRSPGGAGGVLSFGRARPSMVTKDRTGVTFLDVAGIDEAKEEVREIVEFLKDPLRFSRMGARIPRGVLLVGPPGTGKTLLAKAIAGEADVPFFSISGSDFVEMFVGVGASRVRDLFRQAREKTPCLIFLDEIDAVGRRRGSGLGGGHDEREQTLNAILVEMDGFETDEGIILIAATNRPDVLDPALLRPGRFDRQIVIDFPDIKGREAILKVHIKGIPLAKDVSLEVAARGTPGFSGAELASLVNEAALRATLLNRDVVAMADFEEARDRVRFGREKMSKTMDEKDRRITAYHEAGHTLVGALHPDVEPMHKVTIIPRGLALGATMILPQKDRYHQRRGQLQGMISFAFGGRIAEEVFFGDITSGAYDDIRKATEIARMMVCQLGMSEKLGPVNLVERDDAIFLGGEIVRHRNYSEETARQIDAEVRRILEECYNFARSTILENKSKLETLAEALLKFETIHSEEVNCIVREGKSADEARAVWLKSHPLQGPKTESDKLTLKPAAVRFEEARGDLPPAGEPAVT